jgi:murein DD-endopeptidase MepM/ murein hydrolase activator NlpD
MVVGKKVSQGDVIGSVGQTGWATGPHLHFEFRINDQPADPMSIALTPAKPLAGADLKRFEATVAQARQHLNQAASLRVARFE